LKSQNKKQLRFLGSRTFANDSSRRTLVFIVPEKVGPPRGFWYSPMTGKSLSQKEEPFADSFWQRLNNGGIRLKNSKEQMLFLNSEGIFL
jgi:hypothetical protein